MEVKQRKPLTVTALNKYIKSRVDINPHLANIYIKGELSNVTVTNTNNLYCTLKDEKSQIRVIMFDYQLRQLTFKPKDGDKVLIDGKLNVYVKGGSYSIIANTIKLEGIGDLYEQYLKSKKELEEKGYFDEKYKKPIPRFPKRIGVVTSQTGAVIQDILDTVNRRYRLTEILLYPAKVQGDGAKEEIAAQIKRANKEALVDVLIVGRGGGSLEDLWVFNEMEVVQSIFDSKIPVIAAVGHQTDFTLTDFVSSLRVPTPTAAAEAATPEKEELKRNIETLFRQARKDVLNLIEENQIHIVQLNHRLEQASPKKKLEENLDKVEKLKRELNRNFENLVEFKKFDIEKLEKQLKSPQHLIDISESKLGYLENSLHQRFLKTFDLKETGYQILVSKLSALNPLNTLEKGFGLVKKDGKIVRSVKDVDKGDKLDIQILDGNIKAEVIEKEQDNGK